jgi:hypothetical protein
MLVHDVLVVWDINLHNVRHAAAKLSSVMHQAQASSASASGTADFTLLMHSARANMDFQALW